MNKLNRRIIVICFIFVASNALSQGAVQSNVPKKILTKEQKDSIQVRSIAGTYQELLRATVAALHSLGYEEIKADSGVGLVTASLPEEDLSSSTAARTAGAIASAFTFGIVGDDDKTTVRSRDITILVTSAGSKNCKVKISLKQTTVTETDNWVSTSKKEVSDLTDTPKAYDDIFNEISNQYASDFAPDKRAP